MESREDRYFIENGKLYCRSKFFGVYEVVCTVEALLHLFEIEEA